VARHGVAVLTRTVFIESVGRFEKLFSQRPPLIVAQYVERVPMVKGRLDQKASTATGYCWLVWTSIPKNETTLTDRPRRRRSCPNPHHRYTIQPSGLYQSNWTNHERQVRGK
jgi:hypothetical protein